MRTCTNASTKRRACINFQMTLFILCVLGKRSVDVCCSARRCCRGRGFEFRLSNFAGGEIVTASLSAQLDFFMFFTLIFGDNFFIINFSKM